MPERARTPIDWPKREGGRGRAITQTTIPPPPPIKKINRIITSTRIQSCPKNKPHRPSLRLLLIQPLACVHITATLVCLSQSSPVPNERNAPSIEQPIAKLGMDRGRGGGQFVPSSVSTRNKMFRTIIEAPPGPNRYSTTSAATPYECMYYIACTYAP